MSQSILTSAFTALRNQLSRRAAGWFDTPDDVEDALQDTFVRLWPYANQLDSNSQVKAMAITTLRNLGVDHIRKAATHPPEVTLDEHIQEDQTNAFIAHDALAEDEQQRFAQQIIRQNLTPLQADILRMKEYEQLDYATIAERLHMQQPAVRMQLSRARKALREAWRKANGSSS